MTSDKVGGALLIVGARRPEDTTRENMMRYVLYIEASGEAAGGGPPFCDILSMFARFNRAVECDVEFDKASTASWDEYDFEYKYGLYYESSAGEERLILTSILENFDNEKHFFLFYPEQSFEFDESIVLFHQSDNVLYQDYQHRQKEIQKFLYAFVMNLKEMVYHVYEDEMCIC